MSDVSDEDAIRRYSRGYRAYRARGIWRTTRHTDKRKALHCSRPPVDQSGKRMANWTGKSSDTRDILVAMQPCGYRAYDVGRVGEDVTRMLRCYKETLPVKFQLKHAKLFYQRSLCVNAHLS